MAGRQMWKSLEVGFRGRGVWKSWKGSGGSGNREPMATGDGNSVGRSLCIGYRMEMEKDDIET